MTIGELCEFLHELDVMEGRDPGLKINYLEVADNLMTVIEGADDPVRQISLYLQRLDCLDDRLADHPKYFEYLAREILGIEPNPHPDTFEHVMP